MKELNHQKEVTTMSDKSEKPIDITVVKETDTEPKTNNVKAFVNKHSCKFKSAGAALGAGIGVAVLAVVASRSNDDSNDDGDTTEDE
jgi:hypothetical protein